MVNDVVNVLLDDLTLVDDGAFPRSLDKLIADGVEAHELVLVLIGRNVLLCKSAPSQRCQSTVLWTTDRRLSRKRTLDFGLRDNLLLNLLRSVLGVEDRLDVVLDVVNCMGDNTHEHSDLVPDVRSRSTHCGGQPREGAQPPQPRGGGGARLR